MKDDHAKLSGSYCAITTGLSVREESCLLLLSADLANVFGSGPGW